MVLRTISSGCLVTERRSAADIRFYVRFVIFVQKNGERDRIYFAGAMIRFNVIPEKL